MRINQFLLCAALLISTLPLCAQMVTRDEMPGFDEAFGLKTEQKIKDFTIAQTASSLGANVLWPDEKIGLTFVVSNTGAAPLKLQGKLETIAYSTRVEAGDVWVPHVSRESVIGSVPLEIEVPAKGTFAFSINAGSAGKIRRLCHCFRFRHARPRFWRGFSARAQSRRRPSV